MVIWYVTVTIQVKFIVCSFGLAAMTSASHAEGRGFDPHNEYKNVIFC
jgi:hypothetical protein